ncbi:MAG TPA: hypothetical protein VG253_20495 [Streptosporangiaceae bacterium]|jgi:hypothetical protein|nr:hypothetical protein [Streptosporangiaceae bacterium]
MAVEATGWLRSLLKIRPSGATPKGVDMRAEDGDQLGRDGHPAGLVGGPVLEPALVVRGVAVGPAPVDLGAGLLQGEAAPSGLGQVAVLASEADDLGRSERGVVHAGVEAHEPLTAGMRSAPLLADVGHGSEQLAGLARVDDDTAVYHLGDLGRPPAHPVEGVGLHLLLLQRVPDHVGEHRALARDRRRTGRLAVLLH